MAGSTLSLIRTTLVVLLGSSAILSVQAALANDVSDPQGAYQSQPVGQASQFLHYSGGNDRVRVEIAPNYSEELGWSVKSAAGTSLSDDVALGAIVEYGDNKREFLSNLGIQLNDVLSLVGTVGMLEERNEYVDGEGRDTVQQMEYGISLKGALETGILSGFELNGYLADADTDSDSVETGKLSGVQLLTDVELTDITRFKLGGGYEWLEWNDTNDDDSRWTFSAEAAQQLGDTLSLTGYAKLGASEYVYGGGLAFDLSNGGPNTNTIGVNYSYIDGKNGIEDDRRVELSWSIGFGADPASSVAAADLTDSSGAIHAAADVAMVSPANNLLNDVMKRPAFLPERVIARAAETSVVSACPYGVSEQIVGPTPVPANVYYRIGSEIRIVQVFLYNISGAPDLPNPQDVLLASVPASAVRNTTYSFPNSLPGGALVLTIANQPGCNFTLTEIVLG